MQLSIINKHFRFKTSNNLNPPHFGMPRCPQSEVHLKMTFAQVAIAFNRTFDLASSEISHSSSVRVRQLTLKTIDHPEVQLSGTGLISPRRLPSDASRFV